MADWNWGSWGNWGQQPKQPQSPFFDAIQNTATQHGLDPSLLHAFVKIESGGNPNNRTGSYKGLLQLSDSEFNKYGGQGNIFDPNANLQAGALKLKAESADFAKQFGRQPTAAELYLMHQQGVGGARNHWTNPERLAWQNMADTAEGRQKGPAWARAAIWGNVPDDLKKQFGSVDNMTSADFVKLWTDKVARLSGQPVTQPSQQQADPQMNLFDPELLRRALMQQGPMDPNAAYPSPTHYNQQPVPTEGPALQQFGLQPPATLDRPTMAPAQPVMPQMQAPEQKPMGFLERLEMALNRPTTQQGLGLFLAASQGADLNKGLNAGMDRASAAIKNQELQRQAKLRDMREAFLSNMQTQPWAQNLPAGLREIMPMLGPDNAAGILGNYFLNQETNALNRDYTKAKIASLENENIAPFDPDKGLFDKKSGRVIREPQNPGNKKFIDTANEESAKRYSKLSAEADTSAGLGFDLSRLSELNKNIGDAGKYADWKVAAAPWAKSLGYDLGNVDDLQTFQDIVTRLAPKMRPEGSGATSDYEMRQYLASLPQLSRSPEARARVIDAMQDGINFSRERAAIAKDILGGKLPRDAGEAKIEALVKSYEARAGRRLQAAGINPSQTTPTQQTFAPQPDQQMVSNLQRNIPGVPFENPNPNIDALGNKVAASAQQNKSMQVGATKQVHGQWFRKTAAGWEPIANPSHQRTPTFSEAVQSPDMWKGAMRAIPPLSVLVGGK